VHREAGGRRRRLLLVRHPAKLNLSERKICRESPAYLIAGYKKSVSVEL
jgi:hypothetical protein